jgi:16S rRNA A1518/A1519 N6-dimethyltransferase RsmA/KsgA/DIM1 with predicted DNA glycosylase/AP lyase activity
MCLPEDYSKALQFNSIIRFLHSIRYKNLKKICREHFTNNKITIFEIGAGIGKTYDVLNEEFSIDYYGIESVPSWYFDLHKKHENKKNFILFQGDVYEFDYTLLPDINLVVALETFEHIHASRIQKILNDLKKLNARHYFFSVPAEIGPSILIKNIAIGDRFIPLFNITLIVSR